MLKWTSDRPRVKLNRFDVISELSQKSEIPNKYDNDNFSISAWN